jgi:hypothetical protein
VAVFKPDEFDSMEHIPPSEANKGSAPPFIEPVCVYREPSLESEEPVHKFNII